LPNGPAVAPDTTPSGLPEPHAYAFGPFRIVPGERVLRRGDRVLALPPKAFDTLLLLAHNAGHLMRKEDLMNALWPNTFVEEVNLASKVSLLRKVLGDSGPGWSYIQTVAKVGYRFLPAVTRVWSTAAEASVSNRSVDLPRGRPLRFIALPFQLASGDDDTLLFLAFSLPEAVSASLAGLRSVTVRSSLLAARLDPHQDPRRLAEEADVDFLLSGRILCDGGRLRVNTELVDARSATLVGSFQCQGVRENIFEIQDSLVRRIVELLLPRLGDGELGSVLRDVPASAGAYEYYLRGAHVERQRTIENMCIARDLYRKCLEEDPDYAPAWARLGRCYAFLDKFDPDGRGPSELSQWAFRRAFALNPDLPLAHNYYTQIEADSGHAQRAMVRLLGQAKKFPSHPELFSGMVEATRYCGLLQESLKAHERARVLDTKAVTSVAHTYFLLGDYERTLEWYPPGLRYYLDAAALAAAGREAQAVALLRDRTSLAPMVDSLRCSLQGNHARSIEIVRRTLDGKPGPEPELKFYLARHLARDGDESGALTVLSELVTGGFFCSTAMRVDPWLRPLGAISGYAEVFEAVLRREQEARTAFDAAAGSLLLP
jgi:DNA-binding winged helix-turn-helix (wHTH) protein/tetratricopeptide (TPR) repeat protein